MTKDSLQIFEVSIVQTHSWWLNGALGMVRSCNPDSWLEYGQFYATLKLSSNLPKIFTKKKSLWFDSNCIRIYPRPINLISWWNSAQRDFHSLPTFSNFLISHFSVTFYEKRTVHLKTAVKLINTLNWLVNTTKKVWVRFS